MSDISETNLVSTASSTIERYVEVVAIVIKDTVQEYGPEAFNMLLQRSLLMNVC
jgi:TATA-box binding protein (TBP) (component of TFIID and TFIIIB)